MNSTDLEGKNIVLVQGKLLFHGPVVFFSHYKLRLENRWGRGQSAGLVVMSTYC